MAETAVAAPIRDERGRIMRGHTLNPKGRPKTGTAFAEAVREHVDPLELINIALAIARGEPRVQDLVYLRQRAEAKARGETPPPIEGVEVRWPSIADSQAALNFLRTSGWNNPVQQIELGRADAPMLDYSKLSQAELDQLESALAKASGVLDAATARVLEGQPAHTAVLDVVAQDAPAAAPSPNPDPLGILR